MVRLKVEDGKVKRKQREKVLIERDGMEQEQWRKVVCGFIYLYEEKQCKIYE